MATWIKGIIIGYVALICCVVATGVLLFFTDGFTGVVQRGEYHIVQAPFSGALEAEMKPGHYLLKFGKVQVWPVGETFIFDGKSGESTRSMPIEVRFADGSPAHIHGTCRVNLPKDPTLAIDLMKVHGFRDYRDLESKLIRPAVAHILQNTASMMTVQESYSSKRKHFWEWSRDQVNNGLYEVFSAEKRIKDYVTGQEANVQLFVIQENVEGLPIRAQSPLTDSGIKLSSFHIKRFEYSDEVQNEIVALQEAIMAEATKGYRQMAGNIGDNSKQ